MLFAVIHATLILQWPEKEKKKRNREKASDSDEKKNLYTWKRSEFKKSKNFNSFSMFNWFLQTFSIRRKGAQLMLISIWLRSHSHTVYWSVQVAATQFPVAKHQCLCSLSFSLSLLFNVSAPNHFSSSNFSSVFSFSLYFFFHTIQMFCVFDCLSLFIFTRWISFCAKWN